MDPIDSRHETGLVLPTIKAVSFSRLLDYEQCPQRAKLAYIDRRPKPKTLQGEAAANRGTAIHATAEKFVRSESDTLIAELAKPKIAERLTALKSSFKGGEVEVEQEWAFTVDWETTSWFADNCWLRVKCDVVDKSQPIYDITDWKSGKRFGNEVKHSQQGLLYGISTFMRYPTLEEVKITMAYTDENKVYTRQHKREAMMKMLPSYDSRLKKVTTATAFPAKPSKITCRFCPYGPNNGGDRSCRWGVEV